MNKLKSGVSDHIIDVYGSYIKFPWIGCTQNEKKSLQSGLDYVSNQIQLISDMKKILDKQFPGFDDKTFSLHKLLDGLHDTLQLMEGVFARCIKSTEKDKYEPFGVSHLYDFLTGQRSIGNEHNCVVYGNEEFAKVEPLCIPEIIAALNKKIDEYNKGVDKPKLIAPKR